MAGLIDITEALCMAVVRGQQEESLRLTKLAAEKMGAPRGTRVQRLMDAHRAMEPKRVDSLHGSKFWQDVREPRFPWAPPSVVDALGGWLREASHGEALALRGERVLPLLLSGESRCGKTSLLCALAVRLGIPVKRLSLAETLGAHLGETARLIRSAFAEARQVPTGALWLVDEVDGIAGKRYGSNGAEQERATGVNTLLTEMESLPLGMMLAATTNRDKDMDPAVLGRFSLVTFPPWERLSVLDKLVFSSSHGHRVESPAASYADAVKHARQLRVDAIIAEETRPKGQLEIGGAA